MKDEVSLVIRENFIFPLFRETSFWSFIYER